jgi:AcrR family transcriptional regulator
MSSAAPADAVAPKRKRGIDRVDAILKTAILLFAARDYGSVTMTEIAARSGTAIGSLYRFFPTKDALSAAILDRYGAHLIGALDQIVAQSPAMTADAVAQALVALMRDLQHERAAALALAQVQEDGSQKRRSLRTAMIARLSAILARGQSSPAFEGEAWLLLYMLKAIRSLDQDRPDLTPVISADACRLVALQIAQAWQAIDRHASGCASVGADQTPTRSGL